VNLIAGRGNTVQRKSATTAPTLVHVARLAGVGLGTASRALSGNGYVRKATLEKILEAADRLGYQCNEVARSLRARQSHVIGIVVPDIGGPFMIECVRSAQTVLRQHGYMSILAFSEGDPETERDETECLLRRQIDGLLVVPAAAEADVFDSPQSASVPVVFFDQPLSNSRFDAVLVKNREGAREATTHLVEHGHRRIACIGVNRHLYSIRRRMEGYRDAMKKFGLPEYLSVTEPDRIDGQIDEWLLMDVPPTAIFGLNELSSIRAVQALASRKVRMPDQIAFIGFDEIQLGAWFDPPLSAVVQPSTRIGEEAALRLLQRIDAKEPPPGKHILLDTMLVPRGSCGCRLESKPVSMPNAERECFAGGNGRQKYRGPHR
jgi:LacI family transcriptional regulator